MVQLTDPENNSSDIDPASVLLIFYSKFLSTAKAKSNVIYAGQIRSFRQTPEEAAHIIGALVRLIQLTLPDDGVASVKGPAWFNNSKIQQVKASAEGALIKLSGQKGTISVLETKEQVDALRAAPAVA